MNEHQPLASYYIKYVEPVERQDRIEAMAILALSIATKAIDTRNRQIQQLTEENARLREEVTLLKAFNGRISLN